MLQQRDRQAVEQRRGGLAVHARVFGVDERVQLGQRPLLPPPRDDRAAEPVPVPRHLADQVNAGPDADGVVRLGRGRQRPVERAPDVGVDRGQTVERHGVHRTAELVGQADDHVVAPGQMAPLGVVDLTRVGEPLDGEPLDRLQHLQPGFGVAGHLDQARRHEAADRVEEHRLADRGGDRVQAGRAAEDAELPERPLVLRAEQVVAPLDGPPEGAVPVRAVARGDAGAKTEVEPRRERGRPPGRRARLPPTTPRPYPTTGA
ncbi:MAG TPA: hypothetical protein VIE19_01130 [Lapillicoccus sp.]